jgi:hypothetical protein
MVSAIVEVYPGDPIQGFCDFLNHRFALARERGADVANEEALQSWIENGMPGFPVGVVDP